MSATLDLQKIIEKLKRQLRQSFSPREMQKVGNFVVEEIKSRSRDGKGVSRDGGSEKRFPALSPEYIKQRKRMKLSRFTTSTTSNITRTGRLLGGLRYKASQGSVTIEPTGNSREGTPNIDIAGYLADQGRPFMALSKLQMNRLVKYIEKEIIDIR